MRNKLFRGREISKVATMLFAAHFITTSSQSYAAQPTGADPTNIEVKSVSKTNPTAVDVVFNNNQRISFDFYGDNIFRLFQDNKGGILRDPVAEPEAQILVDNPRRSVSKLSVDHKNGEVTITTSKIKIVIDKETTLFKVINLATGKVAIEEVKPILFEKSKVTLTLKENPEEYFYGGGVQNGRFSHKGKTIDIENQNSWNNGGVASPTPFYWSTNGYGMMWHTFKKGEYNFGSLEKGEVSIHHTDNYLDLFFMVNDGAVPLLNDFYQLTGNPVFMPKFGFYQGHLNAYNRDYWTETEEGGVLFEDGKHYKESGKDDTGIKETLNGNKENYQFSARAVIDRYNAHDMPLGWLLPNDGYGAGYGQDSTIDGNIQNLKSLTNYAQEHGVEIGLWTQSDLHPKEGVDVLLQRDIVKEVRDAGVRVLKTDVAWVGAGYSFGLNGITDVANIMTYYGDNSRPFIISLDGWAGTQRYAGIWSGDQSGGDWEYIRFHIPTYIGSGLSGQPNISSDMDGIFGGKHLAVNTRDFQWKTFTPQELNMDGWGSNEKYPHALGEPIASINRWYLKMKSELMPYTYSIAEESTDGMPMVRAMFLEYPNSYTLGKATQYQFLYGSNFLVAPIYQETETDEKGNDIRDNIYLPKGEWVDYFTGDKYSGEMIINNFDAPLWKLPVFVKNGAIIPITEPNNNVSEIDKGLRKYEIYPYGQSSFTEYDDDGVSELYRSGAGATTLIESNVDSKNNATITIHVTKGDFAGFEKLKNSAFVVNVTEEPSKVSAKVLGKKVKLTKAATLEEYNKGENIYFYDAAPNINKFATKGSEFEKLVVTKNPQMLIKLAKSDITAGTTTVSISDFVFEPANRLLVKGGDLAAPSQAQVTDDNTAAYTLKPTWNKVENADYYEIEFNNMLYSTITNNHLLFDNLTAESDYTFKLRSVNKDMSSTWAEIAAQTKSNPLEFAITGITAKSTVASQGSQDESNLFDFDESNTWHTVWGKKAVPFETVIDLGSVNQLDKLHYLPRIGRGNGILQEGTISYSSDKKSWSEAVPFEWKDNDDIKIFEFNGNPTTRFIKLSVTKAIGDFGSGREIYIFKVPGTQSLIPGDINSDGKVDSNDLTSYTNYTGLRRGDSDFEGYVSVGDVNNNDLIDAYDISVVATKLDGGVAAADSLALGGTLELTADKKSYKAGDIATITVKGIDMKDVNALSFALPYDPMVYEYVTIKATGTKESMNFTNDRLHTNGVKSLYPTFVNLGDRTSINGSEELFTITFKVKKNTTFNLDMKDAVIVDSNLESKEM